MDRTWSGPEGSSHTTLCLRVPFISFMKTPEYYMRLALKEAKKAEELDEVPIGCVIVYQDQVIAKAHNQKETKIQPTFHAELLALQKAVKKLGTMYLNECDMYVTLEPCMMCSGAIYHSRINRLYYGTEDPKAGAVESVIQMKNIPLLKTYPKEIHCGILKEECAQILKDFFRRKRQKVQ